MGRLITPIEEYKNDRLIQPGEPTRIQLFFDKYSGIKIIRFGILIFIISMVIKLISK